MDAKFEAEDKQKKMVAQQPKAEPIVGMKRYYNEEEGKQSDIYDVYPNKEPRLMTAIDINNNADNSVANPNLIVTFSYTDSSDEKGMAQVEYYREEGTLPTPGWWTPLEGYQGWRFNIDLKLPLETKIHEGVKLNIIAPAFYLLEFDTKGTQTITIPRDASMTDIKDHPSFWFLKQVL
jgi:hypothetical protein